MIRQAIPFNVAGIAYIWEFREGLELLFYARDSNDKLAIYSDEDLEFWEAPLLMSSSADLGINKSPVAVVKKAADISARWLQARKPPHFWVRCRSVKKLRIFERIAGRLAPGLGYTFMCADERIYFSRIEVSA